MVVDGKGAKQSNRDVGTWWGIGDDDNAQFLIDLLIYSAVNKLLQGTF